MRLSQPKQLTLRDARDTTRIIAHLGIVGTTGMLSYGSHDLTAPADREAMFRLLAGGDGVLVLETQAPGVQPLLVPLDPVTVEGWHRARCD